MSDNRKSLLIALGAGAALIGLAVAYHFASQSGGSEEGDEVDVEEVIELLKADKLDEVKKDANGVIDSQYFLKLLQFVGATTREQTKGKVQAMVKSRREAYKAQDWAAYEKVVSQMIEHEDQAAQKLLG
jgi:hypothetical protein